MKKLFDYNWIGWLNIIVLQWFFIRLYYVEATQNSAESYIERYGFMFPIIPLTGWWSDYIPRNYWSIKL